MCNSEIGASKLHAVQKLVLLGHLTADVYTGSVPPNINSPFMLYNKELRLHWHRGTRTFQFVKMKV
jgi:hypothetical protein